MTGPAVIEQTGSLTLSAPSEAVGARLFTRNWLPPEQPRAVIILAHGYAEHIGRYDYFATHCVAHGIGVYGLDHMGHGQSDGDYGYIPRFSVFTDGMTALLKQVQAAHPDTPLFLIGHSMGGLIAAKYLLTHQQAFQGAILSGPAIKPVDEPSAGLMLVSRILSKFFPKAGVVAFDSNGLSRDPQVIADYLADPLVYNGKMSARLALEMLNTMNDVQAEAANITLPILLLHGQSDTITAPQGSQYLFDRVSSGDKQLKFYHGLYHEIFNEPERDAVLTDVTDWIARHIDPAQTGQNI